MVECEFFLDCPCLQGLDLTYLKGVWVSQYCRGKKLKSCAVRKIILQGEPVPPGLAPNGDYVD